ncbi:beta-ketoacyl synthase N-terminal-like domain-containing protein [Hymenobacter rubripertinctus]|uniref:Beta-ketoacyl synthase-like N-terminal domain-containing protein n=1 Tax=Hymenobacter rubripertinctus TaxID=2029981 RepID=A0A418QWJ3_9BACT|nr:beta-ketoacyl synthase N-terminal-like domain-containing protein [Hymenobacter rubripertinctus]RIY09576.1 hypothetical protein D0T11_12205 [Hymenobacter rubripertinctus]
MATPLDITISSVGYTSAAGTGLEAFWQQVQSNGFTTSIRHYDPQGYMGAKGIRYLNRATLLYGNVAYQCIADHPTLGEFIRQHPSQVGLYDGSDLSNIEDGFVFDLVAKVEGPDKASPMSAPNTIDNASSSQMAIKAQIKGPNVTVCGGACAGLQALDVSLLHLTQGMTSYGIVGTTEVTSRYHEAVRRGEQRNTTLPAAPEMGIAVGVERSQNAMPAPYGRILSVASGQRLTGETNETLLARLVETCQGPVAEVAADYCIVGGGGHNLDPRQLRAALQAAGVQAQVLFPETVYGVGDNAGGLAGLLFGLGLQQGRGSGLPAAYLDGVYNDQLPGAPQSGCHLLATIDTLGYGIVLLFSKN